MDLYELQVNDYPLASKRINRLMTDLQAVLAQEHEWLRQQQVLHLKLSPDHQPPITAIPLTSKTSRQVLSGLITCSLLLPDLVAVQLEGSGATTRESLNRCGKVQIKDLLSLRAPNELKKIQSVWTPLEEMACQQIPFTAEQMHRFHVFVPSHQSLFRRRKCLERFGSCLIFRRAFVARRASKPHARSTRAECLLGTSPCQVTEAFPMWTTQRKNDKRRVSASSCVRLVVWTCPRKLSPNQQWNKKDRKQGQAKHARHLQNAATDLKS